MAFVLPSIFTAVDRFTQPVRQMNSALQAFGRNAEAVNGKINKSFSGVLNKLQGINTALGGLGVPVGLAGLGFAIANTAKVVIDFEQAQANLSAILGVTRKETVELSKDALRLGASTKFTAAQVSDLQTEYAKLGFTQREILSATAPTLSIAAATNTDLAQAAEQVGSAIRAFQLDASQAARVADVFAQTANKSAASMEKLGVSLQYTAPISAAFGFSIEDNLALLGKLYDSGFDASIAATALRNIMLKLADPASEMSFALGRQVRTLDDMIESFKKLDKNNLPLASLLGLSDTTSVAAFATFIKNAEGIKTLRDDLLQSQGAAEKAAKVQLDTIGGALTLLRAAYQGYVLSVEDGTNRIGKSFRFGIEVATEMLRLGAKMAKPFEELNAGELAIRKYAESLNNMIGIAATAIKYWLMFKAVLLVNRGILFAVTKAQWAYNFATGFALTITGDWRAVLLKTPAALQGVDAAVKVLNASTWVMALRFGAIAAGIGLLINSFVNGFDETINYTALLTKQAQALEKVGANTDSAIEKTKLYKKALQEQQKLENYIAYRQYVANNGTLAEKAALLVDPLTGVSNFMLYLKAKEREVAPGVFAPSMPVDPTKFGLTGNDLQLLDTRQAAREQQNSVTRSETTNNSNVRLEFVNMPANAKVTTTGAPPISFSSTFTE